MSRQKNEKGITLVALIITIIILIILTAVTIKSFWDSHFIDLAMQGAINYTKAQGDELNVLNEIQNIIDEATSKITQVTWTEENEEILLELTGTTREGYEESGWYTGITITVTPKLENTKATGVYITGAKTETKALQEGKATFEITTNGANQEIIAQLIDDAGNNLAEITSDKFSIDNIAPEGASIAFKSNTKGSITVGASADDKLSGIVSYRFEYKGETESSDAWKILPDGIVNTEEKEVTYTYNLPMGRYSIRVIVTDAAGNSTTPDANTTIQETSTILNTAPTFTKNTTPTKTPSELDTIRITATATDPDEGDILTYTLYWGTDENNLNNSESQGNKKSGEQVEFIKSGLSNYTQYYFKIDVKDNEQKTTTRNTRRM